MSQLMMLSGSAESWWFIVVANVQTMIIGHRGFHSSLQPGLAVPHSKMWCQIEVKRRPERKFNQEFLFSQKTDRLTGWNAGTCENGETGLKNSVDKLLFQTKVFFQTLRTSEAAFDACNMNTCCLHEILYYILCLTWYLCWWFQLLPTWNCLLYSLPDFIFVLMIPGSYAVFLVSGVQPMIMGKTFPMKSSHSQWLLTVAAGWTK